MLSRGWAGCCGALTVLLAACAGTADQVAPSPAPPDERTDDLEGSTDDPETAPPQDDRVAGRWHHLVEADAPFELTEVGSAVFDGRIWTAGGLRANGDAVARVLVFDPASMGWSDGPDLPEELHHVAMVGGDRLYVIGGYLGAFGTGGPVDTVLVLDEEEERWVLGPALPERRAAGAAAWDGERVVYAGGVGPGIIAGDVFALEGDRWRRLGDLSVEREHLSATSDGDGRVWFLAGRANGSIHNLRDVDLVTGDEVTAVGALRSSTSGAAAVHLPAFGACVIGGESMTGTINRVECIDASGEVVALPPLARARHGLGAGVVDDAVYAVLGGPNVGISVSGTVQVLELDD